MKTIDVNLILWNSLLKLVADPAFSEALFAAFPEMEPFRPLLPNLSARLPDITVALRQRRKEVVGWIEEWADSHENAGQIVMDIWVAKFPPQTPPPPTELSLLQKAKNLGGAAMRVAGAILTNKPVGVNDEQKEARMATCRACEFFNSDQGTCRKCGCVTRFKTALATEHCPVGKW